MNGTGNYGTHIKIAQSHMKIFLKTYYQYTRPLIILLPIIMKVDRGMPICAAHLGPLLTAFRASCVSDPDIWRQYPLVTYRILGHECFIPWEYMDRFEFDNLDK